MRLSRKIDQALILVGTIALVLFFGFAIKNNVRSTFAEGSDGLYAESDSHFVTFYDEGDKLIVKTEAKTVAEALERASIIINQGDIVIHGMDGFAGAMGISKSTGKGSPVLIVCNPKEKDNAHYIVYYLRTLAMNNVFLSLATGIRERSCDLRWKKIAELPFIRPSSSEQQKIEDYLDKVCGEVDELVALKQAKIEELKEYKKSVIYEYVTGKKEVI